MTYFTDAMRQALARRMVFVHRLTLEQYRSLLDAGFVVLFNRKAREWYDSV